MGEDCLARNSSGKAPASCIFETFNSVLVIMGFIAIENSIAMSAFTAVDYVLLESHM